jgi:hypothetical protein
VQGFPYTTTVNDPSHGIGLTPDEKELWVAGATAYVHVFDATVMPPRQIADIPLSNISKWVTFSINGRYAYPGSGDVVDTQTRQVVAHIPYAKHQLEIDWSNGVPMRAASMYGLGQVTGP